MALTAVLMLAGCLGENARAGSPWLPWDTIDGALRPEVDAHTFTNTQPGSSLRIATFNVHMGADVPGLARAIQTSAALASADILLIQEIESYPAEGRSRASALAGMLAMNFVYSPARPENDGGTHGMALLSRFPLERIEIMRLPRFDVAIRPRDRIALAADIVLGTERLQVVNIHLDTRLNVTQRIVQLRPAVLDIDERAVVGGDFNTNPYLWTEAAIPLTPVEVTNDLDQADILDDYMRTRGFDTPTVNSGPTHETIVTELRLDSIYTRGLNTIAMGVDSALSISDHVPLWIDITAPGQPESPDARRDFAATRPERHSLFRMGYGHGPIPCCVSP